MKHIIQLCIILILTSCTTSQFKQVNNFNKEKRNNINIGKKEILFKKAYIDLSQPANIIDVIEKQLSSLHNTIYIVNQENKINDFEIKPTSFSKELNITNINKLNEYIENTTNYTIYVSDNLYLDKTKIVNIDFKHINKLKKIEFNIDGIYDPLNILNKIAIKSGFSIIYKSNLFDKKDLQKFDKKNTYIKGNNIVSLLEQMQNIYNIYIDIKYKKKEIVISKYKTHILKTTAMNKQLNYTNNSQTNIKNSLRIEPAKDLETTLKNIIKRNKNNKITYDKGQGIINLYATQDDYKKIKEFIKKYNLSLTKELKAQIIIYEFLISNSSSIGTNILSTSGEPNIKSSQIINKIINLKLNDAIDVGIKSDNLIITKSKETTYPISLKDNNIVSIKNTKTQEIFKDIKVNKVTNPTTNVKEETSELETQNAESGTVIDVYSRLNDNTALINIELGIKNITKITPYTTENKTTFLIDTDNIALNLSFKIRKDEQKIITSYSTYEKTDEYQGNIPYPSFLLGENTKTFRQKLIVTVMRVE